MSDSESPQPSTEERASAEFPCEECGAAMVWDPADDALGCDFCGHRQAVPRAEDEITERGLDEAPAERGLGLELRVTRCETCGARVTFEGASTSDVCVYCGSASVLDQGANRNAIRPESLVPLALDRAAVGESFERWRKGLWFRPTALKRLQSFEAVGLYVPYWTFDARVHSDWSADSGTYYYVPQTYTTTVNGKTVTRTRMVQKVRWRPAWGERDDVYDDWLVPASSGLSPELLDELGDFRTGALVPYRPEYLAGWRAEEYGLDLEGAWSTGRAEIIEQQAERCAGDIPGDTYRDLRVHNEIDHVRWKHVLLPIWSLQYRLRGKVYTVLVHGQSGRVVGEAPFSWVKIALALLSALAALALVALLAGAWGG